MSLQEATRKTIRQLAEKGIPAFVDKSGREWSPEAYVRMDMRSTLGNTARAAQDTRCDDYGINLSVNCGHQEWPFIAGLSLQRYFPYDEEENAKRYKQFQNQRAMERDIRATKRECMMLQETGDKEGLQKASLKLRNQKQKYSQFSRDCGLGTHYDRTQVYGYDRSKSANTVWAERKVKVSNALTNGGGSGTIKKANNKVGSDVHYIGTIDKSIYKCVSNDIVSDEVIITNSQIEHIKQRHPNDYERFSLHFKDIIEKPDFILEANKPNTALILKEISSENEKFKTVLRLVTSVDNPLYKNSIITFMRIDDKEWRRLIKNKKALYKSE